MVQLYARVGAEFLVNGASGGSQNSSYVEALPDGSFIVAWTDGSGLGGDADGTSIKARRFAANGVAVGGEFLVNTTTASFQSDAKVAALTSGRFAVTWVDSSGIGGDASGSALKAQLFDANGVKIGGEVLVNSTTTGSQFLSVITELTGGGYVIAWADFSAQGADTSSASVKAQIFDANGNKVGGEFLANTTTAASQSSPSVAPLANGGFAISWTDSSQTGGDTTGQAVRMQYFTAAGAKVGGEILINTVTAGAQNGSSLVLLENGNLLATWADNSLTSDPSGAGIKGQIFNAAGAKVGGEFQLNTQTVGDQLFARVAALPGGGFIATWIDSGGAPGDRSDVVAQVFDATGAKIGSEFRVNAEALGAQSVNTVTVLESGEIVISWTDVSGTGGDSSEAGIKAVIIAPGNPVPTDISLSATAVSESALNDVSVGILSANGGLNGGFTYTLVSDSTGGAFRVEGDRLVVDDRSKLNFELAPTAQVRVRVTDINGSSYEETLQLALIDTPEQNYAGGNTFLVNTTTAENQGGSVMAPLAGGGFITLWGQQTTSPMGGPVTTHGQILAADGSKVGPELALNGGWTVAGLPGGGFVTAWSQGAGLDGGEIKAQIYSASGAPGGSVIAVNTTTIDTQFEPAIVSLAGGRFVVAWSNYGSGFDNSVRLQLFGADGAKIGSEVQVSSGNLNQGFQPDITALAGGGFVVTWTESGVLKAQIYNDAAFPMGGEFQFGDTPLIDAHIAALADGGFVVVWSRSQSSGGFVIIDNLTFQIFAANGEKVGGETLVSAELARTTSIDVAALAWGGFVVTWADYDNLPSNESGIRAQVFDATGASLGSELVVANGAGDQYAPRIVGLPSGDFAVSWTDNSGLGGDASGTSVKARIYDSPLPSTTPTEGNDTLTGTAGNDVFDGLGGNDFFFLQQGGNDQASGGAGNDGLYFGAALTGADQANGGTGTDTLAVQGNYAGLLLTGMTNVEVLLVASGADTRFGDTAGNFYDYVITSVDANVAAGGTLTVSATDLRPGEDLSFNGAAETNGNFRFFAGSGNDTLVGGGGSDGFFFGTDGSLTGADRITGGAGADSIALRGNYVGASAIVFQNASFTGVEVLVFLSGHTNEFGGPIVVGGFDYDVTLANGNIAAGQRLDVNATTLAADESVRLDARLELDGSVRVLSGAGNDTLFGSAGNDTLYGGLGADTMDGSGGNDTYLYRNLLESTSTSRDTIAFGAGDKIDLSLIDANSGTPATNDAFSFIGTAAFSNVAGQLRAFQSGGQWIVQGDINGDGTADLVLAVTSAAPLAATDFIL